LLTWGYDAFHLAGAEANLAWAKIVVGLPLSFAVCSLAGNLTAMIPYTAVSVALWAVAGVLLALVAGHVPFKGQNLVVWLIDRRLRGLVVFPYGESAAVRTTLVLIIGAGVGTVSGIVERLALEWAWERSTPGGSLSLRSWGALLVSVPLTLVLAGATDELLNQPLRMPQESVARLTSLTLAGKEEEADAKGMNVRQISRFRPYLSKDFTTHLVTFDLSPPQVAFVDTVFDNDFALRCRTLGPKVAFCKDISSELEAWMADLIFAGLRGERRWMTSPEPQLVVEDSVTRWLQDHASELSESYDVCRAGQRGRFVFMGARFDNGFEIVCRFRGTQPVGVDECSERDPTGGRK
jgi:hypothetical protein